MVPPDHLDGIVDAVCVEGIQFVRGCAEIAQAHVKAWEVAIPLVRDIRGIPVEDDPCRSVRGDGVHVKAEFDLLVFVRLEGEGDLVRGRPLDPNTGFGFGDASGSARRSIKPNRVIRRRTPVFLAICRGFLRRFGRMRHHRRPQGEEERANHQNGFHSAIPPMEYAPTPNAGRVTVISLTPPSTVTHIPSTVPS